ncbi:hypothetical protein GUJ93_ZPchr0005g16313 [Zizania palustris]|uniref:1-phosphatidylinositol-4-phosphate 5-kinase n=1 Tax=Zizania palustris TaxID=103762 RepID=A0A8J5VIH4_ZIZPA|nr:hypothetical protein GUJ93_ZPchr0005g16313 [Zizania palustris]
MELRKLFGVDLAEAADIRDARELRKLFGVDPVEYMLAICSNDTLQELASLGKSESCFFITQDDRFMIKTVKKSEVKTIDITEQKIDETTTLKDLDLQYAFLLRRFWYEDLMKLIWQPSKLAFTWSQRHLIVDRWRVELQRAVAFYQAVRTAPGSLEI